MSARLHLAICVPTFRGAITAETMTSLMTLSGLLLHSGVGYDFVTLQATEVSIARNMMATKVWREKDVSHLLFVDDDMGFDPETVLDLLRAQTPISGCIYPRRTLDLARLHEAARAGASLEAATSLAYDFIAHHPAGQPITVERGFCKVDSIGMGLALIERKVLDTMVAREVVRARPSPVRPDALGNVEIFGFFDPIHDPAIDIWFSEDVAFCKRWRETCGGEVLGLAKAEVTHVGQFAYRGSYMARLKAMGS